MTCIFCDKDHLSQDSSKAIKLSLDERKQLDSNPVTQEIFLACNHGPVLVINQD